MKKIIIIIVLIDSLITFSHNGVDLLNSNKEAIVSIWSMEKTYSRYNTDNSSNLVFDTLVLSGTGFIISREGLVATNMHVVDFLDSIIIKTSDSTFYSAEILKTDIDNDLVILRLYNISDKIFQTVKFGNIDDVQIGEDCYAIGNPYGYEYTISKGIVSGIRINQKVGYNENDIKIFNKVIQFDAAISPGNSGGPLFNSKNEVIGITTYTMGTNESNFGNLLFGVSINTLVDLMHNKVNDSINNIYLEKRLDYQFTKNQWSIQALYTQIIDNEYNDKHSNPNYSISDSMKFINDSLNNIYKLYISNLVNMNLKIKPDTLIAYEDYLNYLLLSDNIDEIKKQFINSNIDSSIYSSLKEMILVKLNQKGDYYKNIYFEENINIRNRSAGKVFNSFNKDISKSIEYFILSLSFDSCSSQTIRGLLDIYFRMHDSINVDIMLTKVQYNSQNAKVNMKEVIYNILFDYIEGKNYHLIIEIINKYLKPYKYFDIDLKFLLAYCYQEIGKYDKAITIYNAIIDKNDKYDCAYIKLGSLYFKSNDLKKSKYYYLNGLKLNNEGKNRYNRQWYRFNNGDIYNALLKIAMMEKNITDIMVYYSALSIAKYPLKEFKEYDIIKIINGLK